MLVSGLLTCATAFVLFSSDASLRSTFDLPISNPLTLIVVRHWGALVGLFGVMLIYGAFEESVRGIVLLIASIGKAVFISLVLSQGHQVVSQAGPGVVLDTIAVLLFVGYLIWSSQRALPDGNRIRGADELGPLVPFAPPTELERLPGS
jgi:hypothetical protein